MAYVGGKSLCSNELITILQETLDKYPSAIYLEPFCGYLHITKRLNFGKNRLVHLSDAHEDLMHLLTGIANGFEYRKNITIDNYNKVKERKPSFERGLLGFGASYCGGFFNGFVNYGFHIKGGDIRCRSEENFNHYDKIKPILQSCRLSCCSFSDWNPSGCIIYCDPPYRNTTDYGTEFDFKEFDRTVSEWSKTNIVFISEYIQPNVPGIKEILSFEKYCTLANTSNTDKRVEKLFMVGKIIPPSKINNMPVFQPRRDQQIVLEDITAESISRDCLDCIRKYFSHPKLSRARIAEYEKRFGKYDPTKIYNAYMVSKGIRQKEEKKQVLTFRGRNIMKNRKTIVYR